MTSRVSEGLVLAYSPEPSAQAPLMKLPKTLGLSIVPRAAMIEEPPRAGVCLRVMRWTFILAVAAATAAVAQDGREPAVRPIEAKEMQPGYGVVEKVSEVRLVPRERSAAAGGSGEGRPVYRIT